MIKAKQTPITVEDVTDPAELDRARARRRRFDLNWAWFEAHASDLYAAHRGKYVCVAGQQSFVADTLDLAVSRAAAAHPEDEGRFTSYIPKERMIRIYAHHGGMALVPGRGPAAGDPR